MISTGLPGYSGKHQEKLAGCGGELNGVGLCIYVTLKCRVHSLIADIGFGHMTYFDQWCGRCDMSVA